MEILRWSSERLDRSGSYWEFTAWLLPRQRFQAVGFGMATSGSAEASGCPAVNSYRAAWFRDHIRFDTNHGSSHRR